jgi:hypothetical protein
MSDEQKKPGEEQDSSSGNSVIISITDKAIDLVANTMKVEEEPDLDDDGKPLVYTITQR